MAFLLVILAGTEQLNKTKEHLHGQFEPLVLN